MECTQVLPGCERSTLELNETKENIVVATLTIDGNVHEVYNCENIIGRGDSCNIVIKNDAISTKHAIIEANDFDDHVIYDLGSTNRTKLGKTVLKPNVRYFISDGSTLSFADVFAQYKYAYKTNSPDSKASKSFCIPETPEKSEAPIASSPEDSIMRDLDIIESSDIDMFDEPFEEELNTSNKEIKSEEIASKEDIYSIQTQEVLPSNENDKPSVCGNNLDVEETLVKTDVKLDNLDQTCTSIYDMPTQVNPDDEEIFEGTMEVEEQFKRTDLSNKENINETVEGVEKECDLREEDTINPENYDFNKESDVSVNESVKIQKECDTNDNKELDVTSKEETNKSSCKNETANSDRLFTTLEVESIVAGITKNTSATFTNDTNILPKKSHEVEQINCDENPNSLSRKQITDICTQDLLIGNRDSDSDEDFIINKTKSTENSFSSTTLEINHSVNENIIKQEKLNILENKNDNIDEKCSNNQLNTETISQSNQLIQDELNDENYNSSDFKKQLQNVEIKIESKKEETEDKSINRSIYLKDSFCSNVEENEETIAKDENIDYKQKKIKLSQMMKLKNDNNKNSLITEVNTNERNMENLENQCFSNLLSNLTLNKLSNQMKNRENAEKETLDKENSENLNYKLKSNDNSEVGNNDLNTSKPTERNDLNKDQLETEPLTEIIISESYKQDVDIKKTCNLSAINSSTSKSLNEDKAEVLNVDISKEQEDINDDGGLTEMVTGVASLSYSRIEADDEENMKTSGEVESRNDCISEMMIQPVVSSCSNRIEDDDQRLHQEAGFSKDQDDPDVSLSEMPTQAVPSTYHKSVDDNDEEKLCSSKTRFEVGSSKYQDDPDVSLSEMPTQAVPSTYPKTIADNDEEKLCSSKIGIEAGSSKYQDDPDLSEMPTQAVPSSYHKTIADNDEEKLCSSKIGIEARSSKYQDDPDLSEMQTQAVPSSYSKTIADNDEEKLCSSKTRFEVGSSKYQDDPDVSLSEMPTQAVPSSYHKTIADNDEEKLCSSKIGIEAGSSKYQDDPDVSLSEMQTQAVPSSYPKTIVDNDEEKLCSSKTRFEVGSSKYQDDPDVSLSEMPTQAVPSSYHKTIADNDEEKLCSLKIGIEAGSSKYQDDPDVSLSEMPTQAVPSTYHKSVADNDEEKLCSSKTRFEAGSSNYQDDLNNVSLSEMLTQPVRPSHKSSADNIEVADKLGSSKDQDDLNNVSLSEMLTQPVRPSHKSSADNIEVADKLGSSKDQDDLNNVSLSEMLTQPVPQSYKSSADNIDKLGSSKDQDDLNNVSLSEMLTQPVPQSYKSSADNIDKLGSSKDQDDLNNVSLSAMLTLPVPQSYKSSADNIEVADKLGSSKDQDDLNNVSLSEMLTQPVPQSYKSSADGIEVADKLGSSKDQDDLNNVSLSAMLTPPVIPSYTSRITNSDDELLESSKARTENSKSKDEDVISVSLSEMLTQPVSSSCYKTSTDHFEEKLVGSRKCHASGTSTDQNELNDISLSEMLTEPVVPLNRINKDVEEKLDSSKIHNEAGTSKPQDDTEDISDMPTQPVPEKSRSSNDQNDVSLSEMLTEPVVLPSCSFSTQSDKQNIKALKQSEIIIVPKSKSITLESTFNKKLFQNLSLCNLSNRSKKACIQVEANEKNFEESVAISRNSDSPLNDNVDISEMETQPVLLQHEDNIAREADNESKNDNKSSSLLKKSRTYIKKKSSVPCNVNSVVKEPEVIKPIAMDSIRPESELSCNVVKTSDGSITEGTSTKVEIINHEKNITLRLKKSRKKKLTDDTILECNSDGIDVKPITSSDLLNKVDETLKVCSKDSNLHIEVNDSNCIDMKVADNSEILSKNKGSIANISNKRKTTGCESLVGNNDTNENSSTSPMGRGKRKRIKKVYEDFCTEENLLVETNSGNDEKTNESHKESSIKSRKRRLACNETKLNSSENFEGEDNESKMLPSSEDAENINSKRKCLLFNEENQEGGGDKHEEFELNTNHTKSLWNSPLNTTKIRTYSKKKSLVTINEDKLPFIPCTKESPSKTRQKLNNSLPNQNTSKANVLHSRSKSLNINTDFPIDFSTTVVKEVEKSNQQKLKENFDEINNENSEDNTLENLKLLKPKLSATKSVKNLTKKNDSFEINETEPESSIENVDETNQKVGSRKRSNLLKSDRPTRASRKSLNRKGNENVEENCEENSETSSLSAEKSSQERSNLLKSDRPSRARGKSSNRKGNENDEENCAGNSEISAEKSSQERSNLLKSDRPSRAKGKSSNRKGNENDEENCAGNSEISAEKSSQERSNLLKSDRPSRAKGKSSNRKGNENDEENCAGNSEISAEKSSQERSNLLKSDRPSRARGKLSNRKGNENVEENCAGNSEISAEKSIQERSSLLKSDRPSRARGKSSNRKGNENVEENCEENSEISSLTAEKSSKKSTMSKSITSKSNTVAADNLENGNEENGSNENSSLKKSMKLLKSNESSTSRVDCEKVEECDLKVEDARENEKISNKRRGATKTGFSEVALDKSTELKNKFAELGNIDPVVKLKKYIPSKDDLTGTSLNKEIINETSRAAKLKKRSKNTEISPQKNNSSVEEISPRKAKMENSKEVVRKRKLMSPSDDPSEAEEDSFFSVDSENSPARRSSRKRKVNTRLQAWYGPSENVMFTGYSDPKAVAVINKLGGKIVESAQSCTVLVTDKVRRTVKFLCALALGRPIVSPSWISSCKTSNSFLDYEKYLLNDKEAEKQFSFKLKDSLDKARNKQLLEGISIFVTNSVKPPPSEMKNIIECSGGIYLQTKPNNWPNNSFIISCPEDKSKWNTLRKKNPQLSIVSAEVILTGILQQTLNIEKYSL